jgi:hypothetical protein
MYDVMLETSDACECVCRGKGISALKKKRMRGEYLKKLVMGEARKLKTV